MNQLIEEFEKQIKGDKVKLLETAIITISTELDLSALELAFATAHVQKFVCKILNDKAPKSGDALRECIIKFHESSNNI